MSNAKRLFTLLAAMGVGAGGYGLYRAGIEQGMKLSGRASEGGMTAAAATAPLKAGDVDPSTGKKVLYWHDPMNPGQRFDKPGKSPFMDMQLAPVYADDDSDQSAVTISPRVQQNLGVRTAEVKRGVVQPTVEAVGSVAYNERDVALVQARSNGYLERLFARAPLDPVRKGQALAELYVPDWVAAQEEYLSTQRIARESSGKDLAGLVDAAKQRMRLAGMSEEQIRAIEAGGKVQPRLTITAPIGGVIAELAAREGMTVMAGAPLFRINGLATVWVNAEVPESVAALVRPGNPVEARAPALSGAVFKGKVNAILPEVNPATRTLKARVELANPSGQLVPGMFAKVDFAPAARKDVLLVPTEAVISTGKRTVVVVAQGDGKFAPVDVDIGLDSNGQTEVRKGLQAGQKVVVSGQFLFDSEASLRASSARMSDLPAAASGSAADPMHHGEGTVEKISRDEITISHGPIPSLQWSAMIMAFKLPASGLPRDIRVGDRVGFDLSKGQDGTFRIAAITRSGSLPRAAGGSDVKGWIAGDTQGRNKR